MSSEQRTALIMNTLAVAVVLIFVYFAIVGFLDQTRSVAETNVASRLALVAESRAERMSYEFALLEKGALLAAQKLGALSGFSAQDTIKPLNEIFMQGLFDGGGFALKNGRGRNSVGIAVDVSGMPWFKSALKGESGLSKSQDRSNSITAYAPIYKDGAVAGAFYGTLDIARAAGTEITVLDGRDVLIFLVSADGSFVYAPEAQTLFKSENLTARVGFFEELESARFLRSSFSSVREKMLARWQGDFAIRTEAQSGHAYYMPTDHNGWYLLAVVDYSVGDAFVLRMNDPAAQLIAKVIFALLVATLILFFYSWSSRRQALDSATRMSAMANSIPCGVQQFDARGGMKFRYVSDGFYDMCGYTEEELKSVFGNSFLAVIHPDDKDQAEALLKENSSTETPLELKYRIITKAGQTAWVLNRATLSKDEKGVPYYQCVCVDITRLKQLELNLAEKAQADQLTGLLNREAAQMFAQEFLQSEAGRTGCHAFLMMDLDGFKTHNDTHGHVEGDAHLCRVAGILRTTFRNTDILCRLAGDEFVVFMKNAEAREAIAERARLVCKRVYELSEQNDGQQGGISIGVALAPEDGLTFEDLYRKADEALYVAKRTGKNRCVFYEKSRA